LYTRHLSALQVFFLSFFFMLLIIVWLCGFSFFFVRSKFLLLKRNNVKSTMIIFNISIFLSYWRNEMALVSHDGLLVVVRCQYNFLCVIVD
jgi:hypothetical protein